MDLSDYEEYVRSSYRGPNGLNYPVSSIAAEAGEINNDIVRLMRKHHRTEILPEDLDDMAKLKFLIEGGDVLWGLTKMADLLGFSLTDMMRANVDKLERRNQEGTAYRSELTADV